MNSIALCPYCNRSVRTSGNYYMLHNTGTYEEVCPLSEQRVPITGDSPSEYASRAKLVANLACQVQDEDPERVWHYLTSLPATELQRLAMVALAAVPVEQTVADMFSWVTDLPAAKAVSV